MRIRAHLIQVLEVLLILYLMFLKFDFYFRSPISSSIAIEFTSKSISACYNKKITEKIIEQPLNLRSCKKSENDALEDALKSLELYDEFEKNLPAYWTIGIPDNASQNNRKSVIEAVKNY